ncbi:MAG: peptidoglycan-binding protein, partial [Clostridia bacterium]|nr:peptidoglycan-binding protein [Clostridia bacterium]
LSGFGTRFMGLNVNFGDFGIHGTNKPASIGGHFSHGCIRMRIPDAEKLYSLTGYGTKVIIDGGPYGAFTNGLRTLSPGDRGSDVKEMQLRLIRHGFLHGWPDGVFGENTKKAVIAARQHFGLPTGDTADYTLLTKLGIMQFE